MNIDNYKMDQTDELYNRITFDVVMNSRFKVIVEETDNGAKYWAEDENGNKHSVAYFTESWPDDDYYQLDDYIEGQVKMVHNFNH